MIWSAALLFPALLAIAISDLRGFRIPDRWSLPLLAAGLALSPVSPVGPLAALSGATLGYALFVAVEHGFRALRGVEALGRGDAKLMAVGGAWCGIAALPAILLVASLSGLLFAGWFRWRRGRALREIPFAPFLAGGIATTFLQVVG